MYSAQLDTWISGELFATGAYSMNHNTWVNYFKDENNKIHSSQKNYSIVYSRPLSIE